MANPIYHNGADGLAFSGAFQLPITEFDCTIEGNPQDVSNSKDGRFRIGGVRDCKGSAKMHWDSANEFTASPPNIKDNAIITLKLVPDGTANAFQFNAIISNVKVTSKFTGTVDYGFDFLLQQGSTFQYPA